MAATSSSRDTSYVLSVSSGSENDCVDEDKDYEPSEILESDTSTSDTGMCLRLFLHEVRNFSRPTYQ